VEANSVKRRLRQGELTVGTIVFEFNTTGIGHLGAQAGAEFVIFDGASWTTAADDYGETGRRPAPGSRAAMPTTTMLARKAT
jgi:hypothetical protein